MLIKYKTFLGKEALPLHPAKKLNHVFLLINLVWVLDFDQKRNEIEYLRPIKYKTFL